MLLKSDQNMFATIVKVKSLKCDALKEIPKAIIKWNHKNAYAPSIHPSDSEVT